MSKTTNPTKKKAKMAKKPEVKRMLTFQEERDMRLGIRMKPVNEDYLRDFGDELVHWSKTCPNERGKRRLSLRRFFHEKEISSFTVEEWRKRSPYLEGCVKLAKEIIGTRLEEGIICKEYDSKPGMHMMHLYLSDWDKANKYHDDRKNVTDVVAQLLGKTFEEVPLDESKREVTPRDTTQT